MTRIDAFAARLAITSGATSSLTPDADRQSAWLREMERAQLGSWLNHPVLERQRVPPSVDETRAAQSAERVGLSVTTESVGTAAANVPRAAIANSSPAGLLERAIPACCVQQSASGGQSLFADISSCTAEPFNSELVRGAVDGGGTDQPEGRGALTTPALNTGREVLRVVAPPTIWVELSEMGRMRIEGEISDAVAASRISRAVPTEQQPVRISAQWVGDEVSLWLGVSQPETLDISTLIRRIRGLVAEQGARVSRVVCNGNEWDTQSPASAVSEEMVSEVIGRAGHKSSVSQSFPPLRIIWLRGLT